MQGHVCYYSKEDLSLGRYLEMAEKRIQEVAEVEAPTVLDDIFELWHIKRIMNYVNSMNCNKTGVILINKRQFRGIGQ